MKTVSSCGKLYVSGEYAVLSPGHSALIKDIGIKMQATIKPSETYQLSSDMFDYSVDRTPDNNYALIQESLNVIEEFLAYQGLVLPPFELSISGKMEKDGKKFGIGSSGSVVLLTIKALASFCELSLPNDLLFRLAAYVLIKQGDNGSMGDLACIAYENLVLYRSFDRKMVNQWIEKFPLKEVLEKDWGYTIEVVDSQLSCDFMVGWTKNPSISKDMIKQVKSAIDTSFLERTEKATKALVIALKNGNKADVIKYIEKVSQLLENLSPLIYTPDLKDLVKATDQLDCVAKSSGSGGGDCGIALAFSETDAEMLAQNWKNLGIELLYKTKL